MGDEDSSLPEPRRRRRDKPEVAGSIPIDIMVEKNNSDIIHLREDLDDFKREFHSTRRDMRESTEKLSEKIGQLTTTMGIVDNHIKRWSKVGATVIGGCALALTLEALKLLANLK